MKKFLIVLIGFTLVVGCSVPTQTRDNPAASETLITQEEAFLSDENIIWQNPCDHWQAGFCKADDGKFYIYILEADHKEVSDTWSEILAQKDFTGDANWITLVHDNNDKKIFYCTLLEDSKDIIEEKTYTISIEDVDKIVINCDNADEPSHLLYKMDIGQVHLGKVGEIFLTDDVLWQSAKHQEVYIGFCKDNDDFYMYKLKYHEADAIAKWAEILKEKNFQHDNNWHKLSIDKENRCHFHHKIIGITSFTISLDHKDTIYSTDSVTSIRVPYQRINFA